MDALNPSVFAERRAALAARMERPALIMGNGDRFRNIPINKVPFRQDSTLLWLTGCDLPGAALLLMPDGASTLFLPLPTPDDGLWHGHVDTPEDLRLRFGVDTVADSSALEAACFDAAALGNPLAVIAVGDSDASRRASRITGVELAYGKKNGSEDLIDAIIALRLRRSPEELDGMRHAAAVTAEAFELAMASTRPGGREVHVAALFDAVLASRGLTNGYSSIVTVRGEVLHNPFHHNALAAGDLLLLDGGGELPNGLGVDITRTWPVDGRFNGRQKAAYEAVLQAQEEAIAMVREGVRYRDIHLRAGRVLSRWLLDEGLLRGSEDEIAATHAHAVFFPHGVGHLLGMDVHDLEQFGDRAGYSPGRARDPHFGTAYLRLDRDLEAGMVVTIEPGFYVVPAILSDGDLRARFAAQVDWEKAASWVGFGGIRIEDDVLCTADAPEVLTAGTPKGVAELEALVGSGPSALERLSRR